MKVRYSNEVKNTIQEYAQELKQYPISKDRRNQKVRLHQSSPMLTELFLRYPNK